MGVSLRVALAALDMNPNMAAVPLFLFCRGLAARRRVYCSSWSRWHCVATVLILRLVSYLQREEGNNYADAAGLALHSDVAKWRVCDEAITARI